MAKGKAANPADAYRKAQRKKELKKNKAGRVKARDFALVKKDTRDLEDEISKLESATDSSGTDQARLKELKTELGKINKKKEDYVQEHPEHRKLVFKSRKPADTHEDKPDEKPTLKKRNLFKKNGLPRHPERSIYYDPVMNPYGVPPPGLPYVERALLPHEMDSGAEESDDDDIVMPEGPPPEEESEDSDGDIPMPEGPPPPKPSTEQALPPPSFPMDPPPAVSPPLLGIPTVPPPLMTMPSMPPVLPPPPPPPGMPLVVPPPGIPMLSPPPHPGFPPLPGVSGHTSPPPPPPGFPPLPGLVMPLHGFPPFPPKQYQPPVPPPPPGFFPRKGGIPATIQDPLSPFPHQTYQGHRAARAIGATARATSGGVRLSTVTPLPPPPTSAVISAEPELRDFKKESTAFVPAALKRKKPGGSGPKVNAAPTVSTADSVDDEDGAPAARPDLLSALHDKFGAPPAKQKKDEAKGKEAQAKHKDDYDKFLEEMSDVLGPGRNTG